MTTPKTLAIASDHGGFELKETLKVHLRQNYPNLHVTDMGPYHTDSVDYPDFAQKVATSILDGRHSSGILICGTGIGISIAANRFKGIRAALVYSPLTAEMSRRHNNANILCLGGRTTSPEDALSYLDIWLTTDFEGGRHQTRLNKLD